MDQMVDNGLIKTLEEKVYRQSKTHRTMNIVSYLTLMCAFSLLFLFIYWGFFPRTPIVIQEPLEIMNKNHKVKAGGLLIYKMSLDKTMPLAATITKQFISDTAVVTLPPIVGNVNIGKSEFTYPARVPRFVCSGWYRMKWTGTYQANPLKEVVVIAWSEPFYVLNDRPGKETP